MRREVRSLVARPRSVPVVLAVVLTVALAVPAAVASPGDARSRHRAPAQVQVSRVVALGQFNEALIHVAARCRPGWVAEELVLEAVQGDATGTRAVDPDLACDGAWHRIDLSVSRGDGGPFDPGKMLVRATLTVVDENAGHPGSTARDVVLARVHPQVAVRIAKPVRLGQGDAILVGVWARCDRPWVAQELTVSVSQDEGTNVGSTSGSFGFSCDDRWHRIEAAVFSAAGDFHAGRTQVDAAMSVLDPIDFDPVATATDSDTVWVAPAAAVKIGARASLDAQGSLVLPLWVKCQRPWLVQDLAVDAAQESGTGGSVSGDFGIVCDARWDRVEVTIVPVPGPFQPGTAEVHAFFTVLDPDSFDPVAQGQDTATVDVVAAPGSPVLWDQTAARIGARVSADASDDTLDSQGADDFVVPAGETWSIDTVVAPGSNGATHAPPFVVPGVNVFIYADGGDRPGTLITSVLNVPPTSGPDDLIVPIAPAFTLTAGTYWISVQADVSTLGTGDGWLWAFRGAATGATGVWQNPGGGFGGGSETWTPFSDYEFDLRGSVAA
jgi:hypothetical protein